MHVLPPADRATQLFLVSVHDVHLDIIDPVLSSVLSVVDQDHVDRVGFTQVHLPPHVSVAARVGGGSSAPVSVCVTIHGPAGSAAAARVLLRGWSSQSYVGQTAGDASAASCVVVCD